MGFFMPFLESIDQYEQNITHISLQRAADLGVWKNNPGFQVGLYHHG
jgi:hypothetical protein